MLATLGRGCVLTTTNYALDGAITISLYQSLDKKQVILFISKMTFFVMRLYHWQ